MLIVVRVGGVSETVADTKLRSLWASMLAFGTAPREAFPMTALTWITGYTIEYEANKVVHE